MPRDRTLRVALDRARGWLRSHAAEALTSVAALAGWALLTWGLARLLVPEVWLLSAGAFLLALTGIRFLAELFWKGLYVLTRTAGDG